MNELKIISLIESAANASSMRMLGELSTGFKLGWLESFIAEQAIQNPELLKAIQECAKEDVG